MKQTKKFMAAAAAATLVVTVAMPTMTEAATFTDIKGHTHEQTIMSLVDLGIIKGYPDGTFRPNQVLTRSDVVKLLGKYLVSLGHKVPTDYKTNMRFTDLTAKSEDELLQLAALVNDLGVFTGSAGKLNPKDQIRRDQMATVLVRAFKIINDFDYVEAVKADNFKTAMTDVGRTTEEHQASIAVFEYYKITNQKTFAPKDPAKRGQFATFLYHLLKVETPKDEPETPQPEPQPEPEPETPVAQPEPAEPLLLLQSAEVQAKDKLRVVLSDGKAYIVTLATPLVEDVATDVSFEIAGQLYTTTATYTVEELEVKYITNSSAGQFQIEFTQPVDLADKLTEAELNKIIAATGIDNERVVKMLRGEMSADKKTLTVTTNATPVLEGRYRITVADIKSDADAELIKFNDVVTFDKDTTGPEIASVEVNGMKVKVKFTEPIKRAQAPTKFSLLIGKEIKGVKGTIEKNATEVEYDFTDARVDGVLVSSGVTLQATFGILFDLNDNESKTKPLVEKFSLGEKDGDRPEVQNIEQYGAKKFKITFSEEVRDLAASDLDFDWSKSVALKATGVVKDAEDKKSYIVTTNSELEGNITIKTAAGKYIRDTSGETNTFSTKVEFITDKVRPSVVTSEIVREEGSEYLELTFDRPLDVTSSSRVNVEGSYVYEGLTYEMKGGLSAKVTRNKANNKKVRVKLSELLGKSYDKVGADYFIEIEFEKLKSDYGQAVNDVDYVTFKRSTDSEHNDSALKVKSIETSVHPGSKLDNRTVVITFNHAVDGLTGFNVDNYHLDGVTIERAKVTAADPDQVELTIKETYSEMQFGAALTINNLRAAGSDVVMDELRQIIYFNESVRPYNIEDLSVPDEHIIDLYFTEALENVLVSSFVVNVNGKKATVSGVKVADKANSNGHYSVRLTLAKDLVDGDEIEIDLNSNAKVTDAAKNALRFYNLEFKYNEDQKEY
ncbi:MAG: S-layer homology domain-containing protein [Solibacillus sp.]